MASLFRSAIPTLLCALSLSAQIGSQITPARLPRPKIVVPIIGKPYSAHEIREITGIAKDGSRSPGMKGQSKVYRDSQGRTRDEGFLPMKPGDSVDPVSVGPVTINILDPVVGVSYELDTRKRVALRSMVQVVRMPQQNAAETSQLQKSQDRQEGRQIEQLGTRLINGLRASGSRSTFTIPANGSLPAGTNVIETWWAPDIPRPILVLKINSRLPEEQRDRLTDIRLDGPDVALFQVPSDYVIQDQ
jgi:hypothetical protein